MRKLLVGWIGKTDLRAPAESALVGLGPIAQALEGRAFDEAFLLSDYDDKLVQPYVKWLRARSSTRVEVLPEKLSGPTQFGEIYEAAVRGIERAVGDRRRETALALHLSPGTPAMAAVWIVGRLVYMQAYLADPAKRSAGFGMTLLATAALLVLSVIGVVMSWSAATA